MCRLCSLELKVCCLVQLQENERKLNRSLQEVKNVEFELEDAESRKKVPSGYIVNKNTLEYMH